MSNKFISSTDIANRFGLSATTINKHLASIGLVVQEDKHWKLTPKGKSAGGVQKTYSATGKLYVQWPENILQHPAIIILSAEGCPTEPQNITEKDFRSKFPAKLRTIDGHYVRSRAELLIDNWLYHAGIIHAYEKRLPIEEDIYSDFYLPVNST
jgi:hypothetical protein